MNLVECNFRMSIEEHMECDGSNVSGSVVIVNQGDAIRNPSSGAHPVNLGVHILDKDGKIVELIRLQSLLA